MKKEDRIKDLLQKTEQIDTRSRKELMAELREKLKEIKENDLLPKNYNKIIAEELGLKNPNKVYQTILGLNADLDIAEKIIELASQKKREQELIEAANKILKSE